jgi:hypothetical protein
MSEVEFREAVLQCLDERAVHFHAEVGGAGRAALLDFLGKRARARAELDDGPSPVYTGRLHNALS